MEGFKYVDIFATKGIEYIIAIVFLIMLVWFWKWLNNASAKPVVNSDTVSKRVSFVDWFKLAKGYYYHQGHTWMIPEEKDKVSIGIDDFAQKLIGQPTEILLPEKGTRIKQGETSLKMNVDGKWIEFLSPVDGEVIAINDKVIEAPEMLNKDPYNKGWLIKINPDRLKANICHLLKGKVARAWIEETVDKLSLEITGNQGVVLQDGGTITSGFIKELEPDDWDMLAAKFFLTNDI
jgi:glycine cleavage system H lipoate-binding protein